MILFLCTVYGMTCQGKWSKTGSGLNWLRECWKKGEQKYDMDFTTWILYTHSTLILCCGMRDPCFVCGFIFMQSCVWKSSFETNLCIIFSLLIAFDKVETCRVTWETVWSTKIDWIVRHHQIYKRQNNLLLRFESIWIHVVLQEFYSGLTVLMYSIQPKTGSLQSRILEKAWKSASYFSNSKPCKWMGTKD